MSWRTGQSLIRGPQPLGGMMGAVFMASHKPYAEQFMAQLQAFVQDIPGDVDWLAFNAGVQRCVANTWQLTRPMWPEVARVGRVSLLDAGGPDAGAGAPVVLVPSMVNRGYVLDLYQDRSLVQALREAGYRVLVVDWGDPLTQGPDGQLLDAPLTLETVIAGRLAPLLEQAAATFGPVALFGYCMGGLLALGATHVLPAGCVARLAVAAMPWDFSVTPSHGHMLMARPVLEPWLQGANAQGNGQMDGRADGHADGLAGVIPGSAMQQYFWMLDPWGPVRRLMAYGRAAEGPDLEYATALEDWLADALALDAPIVREMLIDWYADNRTLRGEWQVSGVKIRPETLAVPVWVAVTQKDNLVPPMCSLPFAAQAKNVTIHMADTGHVGLVCGRKCKEQFFEPLIGWLKG